MIEIFNYGQWMDLKPPKNKGKTKILCHCPKCGKVHIRSYLDLKHSKENIYCRTHKKARALEKKYGPGITSSMKVPGAVEKIKKTKEEKYGKDWGKNWYKEQKKRVKEIMGVENSGLAKDHWIKSLDTMYKKYGSVEKAYAKRQEHIEQTAEKNYGSYKNYTKIRLSNQIDTFREMYNDYSISCLSDLPTIKEKRFNSYINAIQFFPDIKILFKNGSYIFKCNKCGYEVPLNYDNRLYRCPICNKSIKPLGTISNICSYLTSLNIEYIKDNSTVIDGYTFDIYIPDKKIAIDIISTSSHSNINQNFTQNKLNICEQNGISFINIMEDDWYSRSEAIKYKLKGVLGLNTSIINGLDGYISEITENEYYSFCEEYHIWGYGRANLKLGLRVSGILVAVLGLSSPRYRKEYKWEIIRFCIKKDYTVENALRAFLMWLIKKDEQISIIYYMDRRWPDDTDGALEFFEDTKPTGYFWKGDSRLNPWSVFKRNFIKHRSDFNFDDDLTIKENMLKEGYNIIYDCGYRLYIYS